MPRDEIIHVIDYDPAKKKIPRLKRLVKWYKQSLILPAGLKRFLTYWGAWILGVGSFGLALPLLFKLHDHAKTIDMELSAEAFFAQIQSKIDSGEIHPPPDARIELKSSTQAFNHVNDYVIHEGVLWCRRRFGTEDKKWKPFFFAGDMTGNKPVNLSADGANLIVVDDANRVHYRKVLIEARGHKELNKRRVARHLGENVSSSGQNDKDTYVVIDKSLKTNWKSKWYSFPLINRAVNYFTGPSLIVKGKIVNSHRGRYADGYFDAEGSFHISDIGVTTSYELNDNGTEIIKHDPWVPTWAKVRFYFPAGDRSSYVAKTIDASGSTLLSLGYEVDRFTGMGCLKLLTSVCDIDILGGDPLLSYAYKAEGLSQAHREKKQIRILPDQVDNEGWRDLGLPEDAQEFYNQITIIQKRFSEREYRLAAKNSLGDLGYYFKSNYPNSQWAFEPYQGVDTSQPLSKLSTIDKKLPQAPKHYTGVLLGKKAKQPITVKHFGQFSYHSELEMKTPQGETVKLPLHRRWGARTFIGQSHSLYDVVVADTLPEGQRQQLFGQKRAASVGIKIKCDKHRQERIEIRVK